MTACECCGGGDSVRFCEAAELVFYRCRFCGYTRPHGTDLDAVTALYDETFFREGYDPETAAQTEAFRQRLRQYLIDRDWLFRHVDERATERILDYGCGSGLFLANFPNRIARYGFEINESAFESIRRNGINHIPTHAELEQWPEELFDVVMMRGVVEHLPDPFSELAMLVAKLRVGGHFYICATPNSDSPAFLVYGTEWKLFSPPAHLHFFNPKCLALFFARLGCFPIAIDSQYLETPYARPDEDAARFIAAERNRFAGKGDRGSAPAPASMMSLLVRKVEG